MIYVLFGVVTTVVTLIIGVMWSASDYKEYGDGMLIGDLVMAIIMSLVAGVLWPIAMFIGAIVGCIKWSERPKKAPPPPPPKPPTDSERYATMAAEQRALAVRARKDGMEDLAKMQESLADQYEQAANIYRNKD